MTLGPQSPPAQPTFEGPDSLSVSPDAKNLVNNVGNNNEVAAFGLQLAQAESNRGTERSGISDTRGSPSFHKANSGTKVREYELSIAEDDAGEDDEEKPEPPDMTIFPYVTHTNWKQFNLVFISDDTLEGDIKVFDVKAIKNKRQ